MLKSIVAPIALSSALVCSACLAETIKITTPEMLDTVVFDSEEAVLFVVCRGAEQCAETESLLKDVERDNKVAPVLAGQTGGKTPPVKLAFADSGDLPILSEGWDAEDKKVCLQDASKNEQQCVHLPFPIFIGKNAAGVEELARGPVDKDGVKAMVMHATGSAKTP